MSLRTGEARPGRLEHAGGTVRDHRQRFGEVAASHVLKECADRLAVLVAAGHQAKKNLAPRGRRASFNSLCWRSRRKSPTGHPSRQGTGAEVSPSRSRYRVKWWHLVRPHFRIAIRDKAAWRVRRQRWGILSRHRHPACFSPPYRRENRKAERKGTGASIRVNHDYAGTDGGRFGSGSRPRLRSIGQDPATSPCWNP